jgi:nitrite reductase/ring-hydroxylating ferredoxin subunit
VDHRVTRRAALGGGAALALLTACSPGGTDRKMAADGTLLSLDELEVGGSARVDANGTTVIVTRTGDATAVAFDAACTHRGCPVKRQDEDLYCNCHGSRFDARTGAVTEGPASAPLAAFAVAVADGKVRRA